MRNTLLLLSSLALAATSLAAETAQGQSEARIAYTLGASMTARFNAVSKNRLLPDGVTKAPAGRYVYDFFAGDYTGQAPPRVVDYDAGTPISDPSLYALSLAGDATGSQSGNVVSVRSFVDASLAGSKGMDVALDGTFGYRYFLQVTNNSLTDAEEVVFDYELQSAAISGSIDAPYNLATNSGAEIYLASAAGVFDTSGPAPDDFTVEFDTLPNNPPTFSASTSLTGATRRFTLAPGESAEYVIYAGTRFFLDDDRRPEPVPEPASFLPLGLGALALLRRRTPRR